MKVERQVQIEAAAEQVWAAMVDVASWPQWIETVIAVKRLDGGPFGVGSRARVRIKGSPAATWRVTEFTPGKSFTWETTLPPKIVASHEIEASDGGTRLTLAVTSRGIIGALVSRFASRVTERNVGMEAEGFKRHLEHQAG